MLRLLLDNNADKDETNNYGDTPLHYAARYDESGETVLTLLRAGAALDVQNKQGVTALMLAAEKGRARSVAHLLSHGASLAVTDHRGYSALTKAEYFGHAAIIQQLSERATSMALTP